MATYTVSSGILICTGTDITTQGIVAAVNANSGSLNTVSGSAASASTTITEEGYRASYIACDFSIGDGSTASTWIATKENITVLANIIYFDNADVRFGTKNANGTISEPTSFRYDCTNNGTGPSNWEKWILQNGGHFEAYGSILTSDTLLTYKQSVGDVTFEDCFISILDGLGEGSGTITTTGSPTVTYKNCVFDSHVGVGLKLYQDIDYVLDSVSVTNNTYGIQPGSNPLVLVDTKLDTNTYHSVPNVGNCEVTFINSDFTNLRIQLFDNNDVHRLGYRYIYKSLDDSNNGLDGIKIKISDEASTVIVNNEITSGGGLLSTVPTYNSIPTLLNATYAGATRTTRALHSYCSIGYNHRIITKTVNAIQDITDNVIHLEDSLITQTNKTTVDAYTSIDNANEFYDRAKSYLYDNYDGESVTLVTKTADLINAGAYDVVVNSTATQVINLTGNTLTIKSSVFTGDITTTGTLNFVNGATGVGRFTSSTGVQVSISLTFNNLNASTVEIFDNTGASVQRNTNQTGTLVYSTPLGSTGTWSYIVDRIGYKPIISDFDPTLNNLIIDGSQDLLLTAQGNTMYSGSSSALVAITYDFVTPQLNIEIGNGGVSPQVIFDEVEQSLITANGMRWQKENATLVTFDDLPAVGQMLFMQDNIRLKRASAGDVNAAVNGYVLSTQGTPLDGVNGNVNYVASPDYATPVWNALLANHNISSSFGALLQLLETKAQADARQAILVSEHNDTQADIAALNDFDPANDTVANVTLVATTTTNTDMRGTDGANTVAPDNAGITQIQTDISNLNDITAADVYTEFTNGTNEDAFKADVSALATEANATTNKNSIITEVDGNETKIDIVFANILSILTDTSTTIPAQISALNDISPAEVNAEVDTALSDYDAPTKAELDAAESNIISVIPSVPNIADGVWDEPYNQHTAAGTFGKLMDTLRKANRAIEGEVTGTPTTTSFTTDITGYVTGAFDSEVMVFVSGTITGEARPILSYNATNGTFNFEEAWTQAPSANDEFIILPYHVHTISEIQAGLAKTTELNAVETAILSAISGLNDLDQQEVAEAVWDYLQSSTTVSGSMKEAVEKILVNSNLLPATV